MNVVVAWGLAALVLSATPDQVLVLKVGRAITVAGEELEGASILIEAGKIRAIGKDLEVPREARVIALPGAVAMPGIIDCHTATGLRIPNETMADVPFISVLDGVDPSSPALENARRDGVTAVHVMPANATRLGGQGAVLRAAGRMVDEMVLRSPSAMKLSLAPPPGETRMGNMAALRRTFFELFQRIEALAADAAGATPIAVRPETRPDLAALVSLRPAWGSIAWDKVPSEKLAERDRPLVELVRGRLPAFVYCPQASDVFKAFELMDAQGIRATLVLGPDAWKLADVLAGRKDLGPVVLDPRLEVWETDPESGEERRRVTPLALHRAGVRFALQAAPMPATPRGGVFSRRGEVHLWYQAATLVKYGLARKAAFEAITSTPAKVLGLDHRMGTLEPGKDANIAVFSGDPLDVRSWVELVLIEGVEVYRRDKDPDLEMLLRSPRRSF
jgi:imidazolonepropionase-like amidohydrolase